jgi:hypothetical protein
MLAALRSSSMLVSGDQVSSLTPAHSRAQAQRCCALSEPVTGQGWCQGGCGPTTMKKKTKRELRSCTVGKAWAQCSTCTGCQCIRPQGGARSWSAVRHACCVTHDAVFAAVYPYTPVPAGTRASSHLCKPAVVFHRIRSPALCCIPESWHRGNHHCLHRSSAFERPSQQ